MGLERIDFNLLLVLSEILRERSVTKAASNLGRTQPAVSLALQKLRQKLGDQIIVRVGRNMQLTQRGEQLATEIQELMDAAQRVLEPKDFNPQTCTKHVKISGIDYLLYYLSPHLMPALKQRAPQLTLKFNTLGPKWQHDLTAAHIDLAFAPLDKVDTSLLSTEQLYEDPVKLVFSKSNAALNAAVTLDNFCASKHVIFDTGDSLFAPIEEIFATYPRLAEGAIFTPHVYVIFQMVAFSNYLALMPESLSHNIDQVFPIRISEPPLDIAPIKMAMAWDPRNDHDPLHSWIRSQVRDLVLNLNAEAYLMFKYCEF
ncbi:MAG: LysR family transcriptional regulator [Pseudomonadota bacterium]